MKKNNLFNTTDCILIFIVSLISLSTRFWLIADPDCVTFDEVHFGNFSNWYIHNQFFFDIHPPLAKMIMSLFASLSQYKGNIEYEQKIGKPYNEDELYFVSQRITPAVFSALTSPLIYSACRCLKLSSLASFCAGIILTSDISMIVEGKFILSDGILHFFTALHIFTFCLFLSDPTTTNTIISGFTLGCAAACKYTALGLYALDGLSQIGWIIANRPKLQQICHRAFLMLMPSFAAFLGAWYIHFIILPYTGHNSEYFPGKYSKTLVPKEKEAYYYWGDRLRESSILERIYVWNKIMNEINMKSAIPHPWESSPIYWPLLMDKSVGFYGNQDDREIFCMGTPFVYWFVFAGLIGTVISIFFKKADWRNMLLCLGWLVSYFPFLLVPRTLYLYHYLIPLMFGIMNLVTLIENIFNLQHRAYLMVTLTILCFICYLYFSPWAYGIKFPNASQIFLWSYRWVIGAPKKIDTDLNCIFNTTERHGELPL